MPGPLRECLEARIELLNGLLHNTLGCAEFASGRPVEGQRAAVGRPGSQLEPAILNVQEAAVWLEAQESYDYSVEAEKLLRTSYRYGLYIADPREPQSEPVYRFELHRFTEGRARAVYGNRGLDHVHTAAGAFGPDAHVPTGPVTLEAVLRFVFVEGPLEAETAQVALVAHRITQTDREVREWVLVPVWERLIGA